MHAGNQQMFCVHFMEEYSYKSQRGVWFVLHAS